MNSKKTKIRKKQKGQGEKAEWGKKKGEYKMKMNQMI